MQRSLSYTGNVAVLGGGGYLGRHVARFLNSQGVKFWVVGRRPSSELTTSEFPYRSSLSSLEESLEGANTVIHLASLTTPATAEADPKLDLDNVHLTVSLSSVCRKIGVSHVVFASSGGTIYGDTLGHPATEETRTQCSCFYASSKLASENHLRIASERGWFRSTILRISNLYGGSQQLRGGQGVISYMAGRIAAGSRVTLLGNTVRDYIHVDDVARSFGAAVEDVKSGSDVYNISSGTGTSLVDLCKCLFELEGNPPNYECVPPRPFDLPYNVLNNAKARQILGWSPKIPLTEGLRHYVEALKRERGLPR